MNLLIFEYVCGGGYANNRIPGSTLCEAYAMLKTLISDCKALGFDITTLLDSRIKALKPPIFADEIISIESNLEMYEKLISSSKLVDAVYVIAPESDQILERLLLSIINSGGKSLNCDINAIRKVSNKMKISILLKKVGLKSPETVIFNIDEKINKIKLLVKDLNCPLVFKPIFGVGCDGLSIVKKENEILGAIDKIKCHSTESKFIVQNFTRGTPSSVCMFSNGKEVLPVTFNQQLITLTGPNKNSEYGGGIIPFDHKLKNDALDAAKRAVKSIDGLKGYIGVDMILTKNGPVILEINPRLTTSYIGLNNVVNFNPAKVLIDGVQNGMLPKDVSCQGYSFFSKIKLPTNPMILPKIFKMKEVVSPPFPTGNSGFSYSMILTYSNSLSDAKLKFNFAKNELLKLYNGD